MVSSAIGWVRILTTLLASLMLLNATMASPVENEEEALSSIGEEEGTTLGGTEGWAVLRRLIRNIDNENSNSIFPARSLRGWKQGGVSGYSSRGDDWGQIYGGPWRTDKRQVRFRQCYFNPISCFRK